MKLKKNLTLTFALIASLGTTTLLAQGSREAEHGPIVVASKPSGLTFAIKTGFDRADLIVAGDRTGRFFRSFTASELVTYDFSGDAGLILPDGHYTYELRVYSDRGGAEPAAWRQSGQFEMLDGQARLEADGNGDVDDRPEAEGPAGKEQDGGSNRDNISGSLAVQGDLCAGAAACIDSMSFSTNVGNADVWIKSTSPQLFFEDTSGTGDFAIATNAGEFGIYDETANRKILSFATDATADAVRIGSGEVGLHTATPADFVELHVFSASGDLAEIRLESGASAREFDLELDGSRFRLQDVTGGSVPFQVELDTPTNTLFLDNQGRVGIGTASPTADLEVAGSAVITGDVSLGSSRSLKHELVPVAPRVLLDDLLKLPLYQWKYRDDDLQATHVGPMAEDFFASFALGRDERHLSPADSAGLALAAIQGLNERFVSVVDELREAQRLLESENAQLRERLAAIEEQEY